MKIINPFLKEGDLVAKLWWGYGRATKKTRDIVGFYGSNKKIWYFTQTDTPISIVTN